MIKTLEIPIDVPEGATHYSTIEYGLVEFWKYDDDNKEWNFYDPDTVDWEPLRNAEAIKIYEPLIKSIVEVKND